MQNEITLGQDSLSNHPMYTRLNSLENIRTFMKYHVFAVWDFMSLLKSLQQKITCVSIPWNESGFNPELVQLINEIVIGEESDIDQNGHVISHFSLYIRAMEEIGADTSLIKDFIADLDFQKIPQELRSVVGFHLDVALNAEVHEVASSFFYGREKLIPPMFQSVVDVLNHHKLDCPTLVYYLQRHIEVDSQDHGPKALKCLNELLDSDTKRQQAIDIAIQSLHKRYHLWDFINGKML